MLERLIYLKQGVLSVSMAVQSIVAYALAKDERNV